MFGLERGPRLDRLRDLLTEVLAFSESPLSVLPALQRALSWTRPSGASTRMAARPTS